MSPTTNITLPSKDYYAFLLSKSPNSEDYVPFALDYKHKSYAGLKTRRGIGAAMTVLGGVTSAGGLITALLLTSNNKDAQINYTKVALGGLGVVSAGLGIGGPAESQLHQAQQHYQFEYLSNQKSNQDIIFGQSK